MLLLCVLCLLGIALLFLGLPLCTGSVFGLVFLALLLTLPFVIFFRVNLSELVGLESLLQQMSESGCLSGQTPMMQSSGVSELSVTQVSREDGLEAISFIALPEELVSQPTSKSGVLDIMSVPSSRIVSEVSQSVIDEKMVQWQKDMKLWQQWREQMDRQEAEMLRDYSKDLAEASREVVRPQKRQRSDSEVVSEEEECELVEVPDPNQLWWINMEATDKEPEVEFL